jgi:hypothetical protein
MAKKVATNQKLDQAEAELSARNEPITYESLRAIAGGGSNDTIQNWKKDRSDAPPAPEAVQMLARVAAQQIWAAASDEATAKIVSNNVETQKSLEAMKQEVMSVCSVKDQLSGLNVALKKSLEDSQKENAQLQVRLLQVEALQREIVSVRADAERRRSEAEDLKVKGAELAGQIKVLREQLKLRRTRLPNTQIAPP